MKLSNLSALVAAAAFAGTVGWSIAPAAADTIAANQWYSVAFTCDFDCSLSSPPYSLGYDGPLPGGGTENSIDPGSSSPYTITLPKGGFITLVDLEASGDQFTVTVNSGTAQATSTPTGGDYVGEDIGAAISDSNFSLGTFSLPAGMDTIALFYTGDVGFGDAAFFVGAAPIPATWTMMLIGLVGVGFVGYRRSNGGRLPVAA